MKMILKWGYNNIEMWISKCCVDRENGDKINLEKKEK
jgi:hypothetical protein